MKTYEPLTASRIKNATPCEHDLWLSDDPGFRGTGRLLLRITPGGLKRFYYRYVVLGERKTVPIGPYSRTRKDGCLTIEQARVAARTLYSAGTLAPKHHRLTEREDHLQDANSPTTKASPDFAEGLTVMDVCNSYASSLDLAGKFSAKEVRTVLNRYVGSSATAGVLAREATPEQFADILRAIIKAGHGRTAAKVRAFLYSAYNRALKAKLNPAAIHDLVDPHLIINPISHIPSLSEYNKAGNRFLSKPELKAFWRFLCRDDEALNTPDRVVRLSILLGGQRCQQLLRVKVNGVNIDEGTIALRDPKGNRSQPREHHLPLTASAVLEVKWLMERAHKRASPYLFSCSVPTKVLNSDQVSRAVRLTSTELLNSKLIASPFCYADIRRTIETTLASMGVSKDIRAQIQSHGLGGVQARHYDRYDYMEEKRSALQKWAEFLASLLSAP